MDINKLDDLVNEYNNTYHIKNKMKPVDLRDNKYIDSSKEVNNNYPKLKVDDHVRISKYKNIFAKGYTPNWSEEVFVIKKVKNTVPCTYIINDLNGEEIVGTFYDNCKRIEKVINKKVRDYMLNGKVMIVHSIAGLMKKT